MLKNEVVKKPEKYCYLRNNSVTILLYKYSLDELA